MAIGVVKLSENGRKTLLFTLTVLCVIQAILGGAITAPSIYVFVAVAPILSAESAEIKFVFATTGLFGTHVIFNWLIGIKLCRKCYTQAKKKSTRNLLLLWTCAGSHTVLNLMIIAGLSRKLNKQIGRAMKNSIQSSMKNYLRDEHIKVNMDNLQYYQSCCGVYSYTDWHVISWLSKYEVDITSATYKEYRVGDENMHLPIIPWSCCKLEFPMQCLHDPLQQQLFSHLWKSEPNIVSNSINSNGCLNVIWKPISVMLTILAIIMSLVAILHIIIFCLARILYTSCRNLILLDDPRGISPGWIFGRGDCGYVRGKTLSQIMLTIKPKKSTSKRKCFFKRFMNKNQTDSERTPDKTTRSSAQSVCRSICSDTINLVLDKVDSFPDTDKSSLPESQRLINIK